MSRDSRKHAKKLKSLALAVEFGGRSAPELERMLKEAKPAFDALYSRYVRPEWDTPAHIGRGGMD